MNLWVRAGFLLLVSLAFSATPVQSHAQTYVLGLSSVAVPEEGIGGVRFPAGDIVPERLDPDDPNSLQSTLYVDDDMDNVAPWPWSQQIRGFYCQKWGPNDVCGENNEPRVWFCNTLVIKPSTNLITVGGNNYGWDTGKDVYVFIAGPDHGLWIDHTPPPNNPDPCGPAPPLPPPLPPVDGFEYSSGTTGVVSHTSP